MVKKADAPKPPRPLWAARLERARSSAGYRTASDFARFMGMSQQRYAYYEAGQREPNYDLLAQICTALGVSTDYILIGRDSKAA